METILKILEGKETSRTTILEKLTPDDICHLKYAPITYVETLKVVFRCTKIFFQTIEDL